MPERAHKADAQQVSAGKPRVDHEEHTHDWRKQSLAEVGAFAGARASASASASASLAMPTPLPSLLGPGISALAEEVLNGADLAAVLADAAAGPAMQLIDWVSEQMPSELIDFVVTNATHHFAPFALMK